MVREYIGISASLGASYDMHLGKHIYDGDAIGIGITMGYSMVLGKRLNLEFSAVSEPFVSGTNNTMRMIILRII